jgi:integrase
MVGPRQPVSGHVALVARRRGPQWYARYRLPDGRTAQKRLGPAWEERGRPPVGYHTRRTAVAALDALLTDLRRQGLVARPAEGATFGDACAEWLRWIEHDRKRRVSTLRDYKRVVKTRLLPEFGADTRLERITSPQVDAWRERLVASGLSARTVNKLLTNLHGVFRRAQRAYGLDSNPVAAVDRQPYRRSGDFTVLTPDEVETLARAAEDEQDAAFYRVAAYTGLRLGELRGLRWADIDFGKQLVHVRRNYVAGEYGLPKSGRVRSVPLIDRAARELDQLSRRARFTESDDLVFVTPFGGPIDDSRLRRRFHLTLNKAHLPHMRVHDLRHTFGTLAVQAWPLSTVQAYMGHANIGTTMLYVHHVPQHDAADRLSRFIDSAAAQPQEATEGTRVCV